MISNIKEALETVIALARKQGKTIQDNDAITMIEKLLECQISEAEAQIIVTQNDELKFHNADPDHWKVIAAYERYRANILGGANFVKELTITFRQDI